MNARLFALAAGLAVTGCSAVLGITDRKESGNITCTDGHCVCEPGFLDCNDDHDDGCETEPKSDPDNCGACDHGCGGGACRGGACQPMVLAKVGEPFALALAGGFLYFTDSHAPGLFRVPIAGGEPHLVAAGSGDGAGLTIEGADAYWGDRALHRVKLDGSAATVIEAAPVDGSAKQRSCAAIALSFSLVQGTSVISGWGVGPDLVFGAVDRTDADGSSVELGLSGGPPTDVALDGKGNVYWGDAFANRVSVYDVETQHEKTTYSETVRNFHHFVLVDDDLYIAEGAGNAQGRVIKRAAGGGPITVLHTEGGDPDAIRVHAGQVFWTNETAGLVETLEGGEARVLSENEQAPRTIEVDDAFVYYGVPGAVKRVAR